MSDGVVIIGGGHAAGIVAASLRQFGYPGPVELISAEEWPPYQRPPLSKQVLSEAQAPEQCYLKPTAFYDEKGIAMTLGERVTAIRPEARRVELASGASRAYGRLVIATGSRLRRLRVPGAELPGVHYLRDLSHALDLREALRPQRRIVVIGGGYIGLEVSASAVKCGCRVTVLELADRVMARVSPAPITEYLARRHEAAGIELRLGVAVERISGQEHVKGVELADGTVVSADAVVVGIGVDPDTELASRAGLETDLGVRVDAHARTSHPEIYAVGDVTEFHHPILERQLHLESVQNAVTQGRIAARHIAGDPVAYEEVPWFWSEQYDLRLQMAGVPGDDQELVVRGEPESGNFSVFGVSDGRVVSVQCVNRARDYMAGRRLIGARASVPLDALADLNANLKEFT